MKNIGACSITVDIVIEKDGDQWHGYAPALKGLHVAGETKREAFANAREAVSVYLESLKKHRDPLPIGPGLMMYSVPDTSLKQVALPWTQTSGDNSRALLQAV